MRTESLRDLLSQFPDIDGQWNFEDLPSTEAKVRELLAAEQPDSPKVPELLTQLARVQGLLGKLNEAGATLLLAKDLLAKDEAAPKSRAQVRFLIEQGRFFGLSMNPAQSVPYFSRAWELAVQLNETFFSVEAAVMLSISQSPKLQNEWLQKVIEVAEQTKDEQAKLWLSQLYVMDGWHSFDFRKYENALASFERALKAPQSSQNSSNNFSIRWAIGRTLRALNRVPEALEIQRALSAELSAAGKVNGHVLLEIGECLQLNKSNKEATEFFELAYKELSLNGWYSDNKAAELSRIQYLSKKK
jgi:tetratricopeptide (TPR) repeat protein